MNKKEFTDLEFKQILNEAMEDTTSCSELMHDLIMNAVTEYLPESLQEDFEKYLKYNRRQSQKEKTNVYKMGYEDALEERAQNIYKAGYESGAFDKAKQHKRRKCCRNKQHCKKNAVVIRC